MWLLLVGRDAVWFVDNASVLHALVKGGSRNAELALAIQVEHFFSYELQCRIWWENWADRVSRLGAQKNQWSKKQGIDLEGMHAVRRLVA